MRRLHRVFYALLLGCVVLPSAVQADAGSVLLRETRGSLVVTLMAGPIPLRAGRVEFDVLVQSRESGAPDLDAVATLHLTGPHTESQANQRGHAHDHGPTRIEASMRPGAHGNGLLQGARIELPQAGEWQVEFVVQDAEGRKEEFETVLDLAAARGPALRHWAAIAAGPAGLALLALHQTLALAGRNSPRAPRSAQTGSPRRDRAG